MKTKLLLLASVGATWMSPASAIILGVDFEGIGSQAVIDEFYNGGIDSQGNSGPDLGLQFAGTSSAAVDSDVSLNFTFTNLFANEPSPNTVMFYARDEKYSHDGFGVVNFAESFDTGVSFFYSQKSAISYLEVFEGLNGTGTSLGEFFLTQNHDDDSCGGDPTGIFCNWDIAAFQFDGVAQSIVVRGAPEKVLFDNLTLGSLEPVPLPAAAWLLGSGLLGFAAIRRRRQA